MPLTPATEVAQAFQLFGLLPTGPSIYEFSPVFKVNVGGQAAILKTTRSPTVFASLRRWLLSLQARQIAVVAPLAGVVQAHDRNWTLYPFVEGRAYQGTPADIASAGQLLGQIHGQLSHHLPAFGWPDNTAASVEEDKTAILELRNQGFIDNLTAQKLILWEEEFNDAVYAPLKVADLVWTDVCMDFKANNLVYTAGHPVLIDPDNADFAPRIFDLALAALLFHLDLPQFGRLLSAQEWQLFYKNYSLHTQLTATEKRLWPLALRYIFQEWAIWHLVSVENWRENKGASLMQELAYIQFEDYVLI